jgi:hypothetical protein
MSNSGRDSEEKDRYRPGAPRDPVRAELKAYLDGELSWPRQWRVYWHLRRCSECREEVAWLRRLGEDMRELERATPRPELRARILSSLPLLPGADSPAPAPLPRSSRIGLPRFAFVGALAALAGIGVFAIVRNLHSSPPSLSLLPPQVAGRPNPAAPPEETETRSRVAAAPPNESRRETSPSGRPPVGSLPIGHAADDPFRPASAPPAPQKIASLASPGTVPGRSDGTYDAAMKLFKERVAAERVEERLRYQEMLGISDPSAARKAARLRLAPPVRLSLASANPDEVRGLLQALVRKMDGTVTVAPASASAESPDAGPKTPAMPGDSRIARGPDPGAGHSPRLSGDTLLVRVPAQKAQALLHTLERMGTLRPDTPAPAEAQPAFGRKRDAALPAPLRMAQAVPDQPAIDGTDGDSTAIRKTLRIPPAERTTRPQTARQANPKLPKANYLTIVIRLHPGQAVVP